MAVPVSWMSQPAPPLTSASPGRADCPCGPGKLRVFVPHTRTGLTLAALGAVRPLTRNLDARVTIVAVRVVPFPLPLDRPDVAPSFLENELGGLARSAGIPVDVRVVMARDGRTGFDAVVPPGSLVVLAAKKRRWLTPPRKLARSLARKGHRVALLEV